MYIVYSMNDKGSNYTKIDIESVLFLEKSSPYIFDDSGKYNSISHCSGGGNIDFYFINKTLYSIDKHKIKCYSDVSSSEKRINNLV